MDSGTTHACWVRICILNKVPGWLVCSWVWGALPEMTIGSCGPDPGTLCWQRSLESLDQRDPTQPRVAVSSSGLGPLLWTSESIHSISSKGWIIVRAKFLLASLAEPRARGRLSLPLLRGDLKGPPCCHRSWSGLTNASLGGLTWI